jgi:uncharacterized protein YPO0396
MPRSSPQEIADDIAFLQSFQIRQFNNPRDNMNNVLKNEMDVLHNMINKSLPFCMLHARNDDYLERVPQREIDRLRDNLKRISRGITKRIQNIAEVIEGLEQIYFEDGEYKDYITSLKPILKRYIAEFQFNEPEIFDLIDKLEQIKK